MDTGQPGGKYWTDVAQYLRNKALDYLRHESMKQQVITRISEKQNEELALRLSSLEDCNPNEIFSKEVMDIVQRTLQSLPEQTSRIFTLKPIWK